MKKRVVLMILLLIAVTVLNARKNIKFFWSCSPQVPQTIRQNILNDIKSSVISSERFLISNEEEIQEIAFEKKVESFFTSSDSIMSGVKDSDYIVAVKIFDYYSSSKVERGSYMRDDLSGDYVFYDNAFIPVFKGYFYSYDAFAGRYIVDKNGDFVAGKNGGYYPAGNGFYISSRYEDVFTDSGVSVQYILISAQDGKKIFEDTFSGRFSDYTVKYSYDSQTGKFFIKQVPESAVWTAISSGYGDHVYSRLRDDFMIKAKIIDFSKDMVYIDAGANEGIKKGYLFISQDASGKMIMKVENVNPQTAEGKILYMERGKELKISETVSEIKNFYDAWILGISFFAGTELGASLEFKNYDVYNEVTSCSGIDFILNQSKVQVSGVSFGLSVFKNEQINLLLRTGVYNADPFIGAHAKYLFFGILGDYSISGKFRAGITFSF
ncbi:MAG TPA: hypothetical protein PK845_04560 [Petrotogaceae bacterium]|nr:hypothetical protein [Petrotogaceae bacterium]